MTYLEQFVLWSLGTTLVLWVITETLLGFTKSGDRTGSILDSLVHTTIVIILITLTVLFVVT